MEPLNLFYLEPDPDRWFLGDRFVRKVIRRIIRGKPQVGGVKRWFLNLRAGLDETGVKYRVNDFKYLKKNPKAVALVIGKDNVLDLIPKENPIVFGPGIPSHPSDIENLAKRNIIALVIPCEWFAAMYKKEIGKKIKICIWAAGINTNEWKPRASANKKGVLLIYDKIRWQRKKYESELLNPIIKIVKDSGLKTLTLRYGHYKEEDYKKVLNEVDAMVFLCEHETQGFAYLQALACNVPILAWNRGGYWKDPNYYPEKAKFRPVTSVPYWNKQAGETFTDIKEFKSKYRKFLNGVFQKRFRPRKYILQTLSLKSAAQKYISIVNKLTKSPP